MDNGASLDFDETADEVSRQHYAFLIGEKDFDEIYGRILDRGLEHWADPFKRHPGRINRNDGGRGVYWEDPDGHLLEVITRPYGTGS
jgi:catechol 2,3-dioxygenase-like lactoylglutathione lyase family enzyme